MTNQEKKNFTDTLDKTRQLFKENRRKYRSKVYLRRFNYGNTKFEQEQGQRK